MNPEFDFEKFDESDNFYAVCLSLKEINKLIRSVIFLLWFPWQFNTNWLLLYDLKYNVIAFRINWMLNGLLRNTVHPLGKKYSHLCRPTTVCKKNIQSSKWLARHDKANIRPISWNEQFGPIKKLQNVGKMRQTSRRLLGKGYTYSKYSIYEYQRCTYSFHLIIYLIHVTHTFIIFNRATGKNQRIGYSPYFIHYI